MNGYQRMWTVASGLIAIALIITFFATRMSPDSLTEPRMYERKLIKQNVMREAEESLRFAPTGPVRDAKLALLEEKIRDGQNKIDQNYKEMVEESVRRHDSEIMIYVYLWLAWTIGSYSIGWIGVWVYRGFRPTKTE